MNPLQLVSVLGETRVPSCVLSSLVAWSSVFHVSLSNKVSLLGRRFIISAQTVCTVSDRSRTACKLQHAVMHRG